MRWVTSSSRRKSPAAYRSRSRGTSSSIFAEPRKQPLIVFSLMKPQVSIVTADPFGGSPTTTAVPPGRSASHASRIVSSRPIASKA